MQLKKEWHDGMTFSVEDAVVNKLQPYGDGYLERATEHAQNCADFLGKLVVTLHDSGKLTDEEVLAMLSGFSEYTSCGGPS